MGCLCSCLPCCQDNITVTLAGTDKVNGTYKRYGDYSGRPAYENDEGVKMWYNEGEWRIGYTRDYYYDNPDDGDVPPLTGWRLADSYRNSDAAEPVPNCVKLGCG
jgi:hypothetical protein